MPDFTPTTQKVRTDYVQSGDGRKPDFVYENRRAEFDRWLTDYRREVLKEAADAMDGDTRLYTALETHAPQNADDVQDVVVAWLRTFAEKRDDGDVSL
jgi:hypothetical protein